MLLSLNDNGKLELTPKAMMIETFAQYVIKEPNYELVMSTFAVCYFMFNYDSEFLDIENESERLKEVKKYVDGGTDVKVNRTVRKVLDTYKEINSMESTNAYRVMKANLRKLEEYAGKMTMERKVEKNEEGEVVHLNPEAIFVDYKEFQAVNSMLPDMQKKLSEFKTRLQDELKSQIDVYGGGNLGAFE